jgi:hypothetical protein
MIILCEMDIQKTGVFHKQIQKIFVSNEIPVVFIAFSYCS